MFNIKAKRLTILFRILMIAVFLGIVALLVINFISRFNDILFVSIIGGLLALEIVFLVFFVGSYRQMKENENRRLNMKREFRIDTYFYDRQTFTREIFPMAVKNFPVQEIRYKKIVDLEDRMKRARVENLDPATFAAEIKKVKNEPGHTAFIAFSCFSDAEKYQYYQLEMIKVFYGVLIRYFEQLLKMKEYHGKFKCGYENHIFYLYFEYRDEIDLRAFLGKIESDVYTLYEKSDVRVNMHPSFGIYEMDGKVRDVYQMVENSAVSLRYAANSFQVSVIYDSRIEAAAVHNDVLEREIRRGITNHEFEVYYQAKFDLQSQTFVGAEALIRWNHPTKGLFNPGAFIGECEKSGLIHVLDFYVFDQVCHDLGDWRKRGRRMLPISINFSSYDFFRPDFVKSIQDTIDTNRIAPNYIEVEITETSASSNYFYVINVLKQLKDMNIRILMDDFGTGFSSLGNLKKYPISALKVDKSFVDEMTSDRKSEEIVNTIITLAHSLGLESIAEGVQTQKQVEMLQELKCNVIQGYYYSKPLPKKDFEIFLSTNTFETKGVIL